MLQQATGTYFAIPGPAVKQVKARPHFASRVIDGIPSGPQVVSLLDVGEHAAANAHHPQELVYVVAGVSAGEHESSGELCKHAQQGLPVKALSVLCCGLVPADEEASALSHS